MPADDLTAPNTASGITLLLGQLGNIVVRGLKEKLKPHGLHPRQYAILAELERKPGISQQAMSDFLLIHRSAMVALLDELETRGFLTRERSLTSRREHSLYLTDGGREVLAALKSLSKEFETEFLADLGPEQRDSLIALLQQLASRHGVRASLAP